MEGGDGSLYPPPSQNPGHPVPSVLCCLLPPRRGAPRLCLQLVRFLPAPYTQRHHWELRGDTSLIHPVSRRHSSLKAPKGRAGPGPRCSAGSPGGPLSTPMWFPDSCPGSRLPYPHQEIPQSFPPLVLPEVSALLLIPFWVSTMSTPLK